MRQGIQSKEPLDPNIEHGHKSERKRKRRRRRRRKRRRRIVIVARSMIESPIWV